MAQIGQKVNEEVRKHGSQLVVMVAVVVVVVVVILIDIIMHTRLSHLCFLYIILRTYVLILGCYSTN